jgi:hypothetical protein
MRIGPPTLALACAALAAFAAQAEGQTAAESAAIRAAALDYAEGWYTGAPGLRFGCAGYPLPAEAFTASDSSRTRISMRPSRTRSTRATATPA